MDKKNLYKSFFSNENQALYRERLVGVMTKNALSMFQAARQIGISVITLKRYLIDEELSRDATFSRIVAFVDGSSNESMDLD